MKTKIMTILIISGIIVSLGANKVSKTKQANKLGLQSSNVKAAEPIGGFVSEDH